MILTTIKQLCLISCLLTNSVYITQTNIIHQICADIGLGLRFCQCTMHNMSVIWHAAVDGHSQSQSQRTARPHIACHQPRPEVSSPGPEARCVFVCFQSIRVFTPVSESLPCQHSYTATQLRSQRLAWNIIVLTRSGLDLDATRQTNLTWMASMSLFLVSPVSVIIL